MQSPLDDRRTRDELLAENARLRDELLRRRTESPMWPVGLGLLVHLVLRPWFDPWLNSDSDGKVGAAVAILIVPVVYSGVMLVRVLVHRPH